MSGSRLDNSSGQLSITFAYVKPCNCRLKQYMNTYYTTSQYDLTCPGLLFQSDETSSGYVYINSVGSVEHTFSNILVFNAFTSIGYNVYTNKVPVPKSFTKMLLHDTHRERLFKHFNKLKY